MKVLIVGEFSGFAKNLSIGFRELGHECTVVSYGDSWKKIEGAKEDYLFRHVRNYKFCKVELKKSWIINGLFLYRKIVEFRKQHVGFFDFILIINCGFIRLNHEIWFQKFSIQDLKKMLQPRGKICLSACGDDYATALYQNQLRYSFHENQKKAIRKRNKKIFEEICPYISGVIPVMFEYSDSYRVIADRYHLSLYNTIPLPVDMKNFKEVNDIIGKIIIFHGLNRVAKGSPIIVEALEQIRRKYEDKVEVIVAGNMPLATYLQVMQSVNIIVDQCWSYSYGMNAIFGMAMGKVVLSGNEPECGIEFKREDVPVVNILPDAEDIVRKLEFFITHPEEIKQVGRKSRMYIEDFHDAKSVAQKYVKISEGIS